MRSIKGISVFLTLAVSLLASTIGAQAQISSGAPTKLVLINSFNDFASVQPAQNQNSVVVVRYGNTVGDQLGGMFAYDPDSVAAGDSKNVFVPASGVGRFVRYDYAAYVPGTQTANRVIVTDGSGNVGTDPQLTFNGADLTVGGNLTVSTLASGSTSTVVTHSSNTLQARTINSDVWNLAADLDGVGGDYKGNAQKLIGPSVSFDGSNDVIEFADADKWSFTDGTDDLPFSISAWIRPSSVVNFGILEKSASSPNQEWLFWTEGNGKLYFWLRDSAGNYVIATGSTNLEADEWSHVAVTYDGAGPNSSNSFVNAINGVSLYVNGQVDSVVASNNGTYTGMTNGTAPVHIGESGGAYAKGHIRSVQLFNRKLTTAEVIKTMNGDLGFADEWAGLNGGADISDFSAGTDSYTVANGAAAGNIDAISGLDNNLRLTVDNTASIHQILSPQVMTAGKRYRVSLDYYIPTQSNVDGLQINLASTVTTSVIYTATAPTVDTWHRAIGEGIATTNQRFYLTATDGGVTTVTDAGGDDIIYIRNVYITEIGALADLRAENFDADTGKLYDISSNAFIGINSGSTLTGRTYPYYETGTWTPGITFGGGATGMTFGTQEGYYTREGNQVTVHAYVVLTAKGSSTGTALLTGMPFTARNTAGSSQSFSVGNMANAASLTSPVTAYATDNGTTINLVDWGATGSAVLDNTNFTDTTAISVTGSFQVQ